MDVSLDIAALAGSCLGFASTAVIGVLLLLLGFVYRRQLGDFARAAVGRVQKVTVAGVSVELAGAAELAPKISSPDVAADLRWPIPSSEIDDSGMAAFTEQLRQTEPVDYSVVDLGSGSSWLTSRLFILSIVLARMRGVKEFVFVADRGEAERCFVGTAAPHQVRWALAQRYAWLEPAFARAYGGIGDFAVVSEHGKLSQPADFNDVYPAIYLVQRFVQELQEQQPASSEWVVLRSNNPLGLAEHAQWLTEDGLKAILGHRLNPAAVSADEPGTASTTDLAHDIVHLSGDYVARVDQAGRFQRLLDRRSVVERVARQLSIGQAGASDPARPDPAWPSARR